MKKKMCILGLFGLVFVLILCCENFMGNGPGEGKLTISLGAGLGRAIAPPSSLPDFKSIRVTITNGKNTLVDQKFDDPAGSYTFTLPAGSGYRIGLDAEVKGGITPDLNPLGRRYGGARYVTVSPGTNPPVEISLSVTETMLVGIKGTSLYFFKDADDPAPYELSGSIPFGSVCFDRYGRLSVLYEPVADIHFIEVWSTPGYGASAVNLGRLMTSVAYQDGNFYFTYIPTNIARINQADMPDSSASPVVLSPLSVDLGSSAEAGDLVTHYVPYQGWGYVGFCDMAAKKIVKANGGSGAFVDEISFTDDIIDMRFIDDILYVLGKSAAASVVLYAYTAGLVLIRTTVAAANVTGANIAGWGKDTVYVYYYGTGSPSEGGIVGVPFN
jgi:hypothetical protein